MRAGNRFEVPESRAPRSPRAAPSAFPSMVNYSDSRRPVFLQGLHRFQQSQLHSGNDQTQRDVHWPGARQARASSVQRVLSFKRPFKWPSRGKDVSLPSGPPLIYITPVYTAEYSSNILKFDFDAIYFNEFV